MSLLSLLGYYLIIGVAFGLTGAAVQIQRGKSEKEVRKTFYFWTIGWLIFLVGIFLAESGKMGKYPR